MLTDALEMLMRSAGIWLVKLYEQIKARMICFLAVIFVISVLIIRGIYSILVIDNGYNPGKPDNLFTSMGINERDSIEVYGRIKDISVADYYGKEQKIIALYDVFVRKNVQYIENKSENATERGEKWGDFRQVTAAHERVLVYSDSDEDVRHGQLITVNGKFRYFKCATNWGEFDSYKYYSDKGVLFAIDDSVIVKENDDYKHLQYGLWMLKNDIAAIIERIYAPDDAAILKTMLLGMKNELPEEIKKAFQKTGIAHLLAISGLHISLLCMSFYKFLKKIGLDIVVSSILSMVLMILYITMTGFSSSAVRAAVMFSIYLISVLAKRSYDPATALGIAILIISSFNIWAVFDFSVILSFSAVISMTILTKVLINNSIYLKRALKKREFSRISGKLYNMLTVKIINSVVAAGVVFLTTLPAVLYSYYEIPLYSVLLNILFVPLMPLLLGSAIFSIIMTALVKNYSPFIALITRVILAIYKNLSIFLENTSFGRVNLGRPAMYQVILYLVCVGILVFAKRKKLIWMKNAIFLAGLVMLLFRNNYGLYMLDVGQGDCFIYISRQRAAYIFDGGSSNKAEVGKNIIIPFLKSKGVNDIAAIFISHPDEDHTNGIMEIVKEGRSECLNVENVFVNHSSLKYTEYAELEGIAEENSLKITGLRTGDRYIDGNADIVCVYASDRNEDSTNNRSLVTLINVDGFSILETGDMELDGERRMLELYSKREGLDINNIDILKVGHHGSSTSTSDELLEEYNPKVALISAGKNNKYGHPHAEVLEKLDERHIAVLNTQQTGAVMIRRYKSGVVCIAFNKYPEN